MMLALPGSAYLYQGEELGLLEVADLPVEVLADPVWERTGHTLKGRDGCRVPLPWTRTGTSFGFGANGSWLPQPDWFAGSSVKAQDGQPGSSLELYRAALALRRKLIPTDQDLNWRDTNDPDTLHFVRSNGWECIINFSTHPKAMPAGTVLLTSHPVPGPDLPPETAAWITQDNPPDPSR